MSYLIKFNNSNLIEESVTNSIKAKNYYYELKLLDSLQDLEFLIFKNYYTAYISIMIKIDSGWKFVLNDFKIMEYPDSEEDSEKIVVIHISKLNINNNNNNNMIDLSKVEKLRIYLMQPNTHIFMKFNISNIKIYNKLIYEKFNSNSKEMSKNNDFVKKYLGGDKYYVENNVILDLNNESIISNIVNIAKSKKIEDIKIIN